MITTEITQAVVGGKSVDIIALEEGGRDNEIVRLSGIIRSMQLKIGIRIQYLVSGKYEILVRMPSIDPLKRDAICKVLQTSSLNFQTLKP